MPVMPKWIYTFNAVEMMPTEYGFGGEMGRMIAADLKDQAQKWKLSRRSRGKAVQRGTAAGVCQAYEKVTRVCDSKLLEMSA